MYGAFYAKSTTQAIFFLTIFFLIQGFYRWPQKMTYINFQIFFLNFLWQ